MYAGDLTSTIATSISILVLTFDEEHISLARIWLPCEIIGYMHGYFKVYAYISPCISDRLQAPSVRYMSAFPLQEYVATVTLYL